MKQKTVIPSSIILLLSLLLLITSCNKKAGHEAPSVTPATALESYLNNRDTTFSWKLRAVTSSSSLKIYNLLLTSQTWRGIVWRHTLTVIVPEDLRYDGGLLFITGGKNKEGMPVKRSHDDEFIGMMSQIAAANHALVAIVWQVPNQPLFNDLTEDQLISYTLRQFQNDSDYTWPLLFPMVKSAVRAMDAVQEFSGEKLHHTIEHFVVSGASKRGWTTWLTGATDQRVIAIAPMVIDVLNMPVNLDYQITAWGDYSDQIEDYVKLGIPQQVHTAQGNAITTMVDPYSYRHRLTLPKLIINGTNDEYWPVDAIKNYLDSIPGENFLLYVPNAGHGLDDGQEALTSLSAFLGRTLAGKPYPVCSWSTQEGKGKVTLTVQTTPEELLGASLWYANSDDRDFRDEKWQEKVITTAPEATVTTAVQLPEKGYSAFFIDLKYRAPGGGSCNKSTRMFVADSSGILKN